MSKNTTVYVPAKWKKEGEDHVLCIVDSRIGCAVKFPNGKWAYSGPPKPHFVKTLPAAKKAVEKRLKAKRI